MRRKNTYDYVKEKFLENGLKLLETNYEAANIKMLCEDENGYLGYIKLSNVQAGKTFSPFSSANSFFLYNFKKFLHNENINITPIFEGTPKPTDVIKFKCDCGNIFFTKIQNVLYRKSYRCVDCAIKSSVSKRLLSFEYVKKLLKDNGYIMLQDFYEGFDSNIEVEDKEGYRGYTSCNAISGGHLSIHKFSIFYNEKYFIYNLNVYCKNNDINSRAIKIECKKDANKSIIKFQCECGEYFYTTQKSFVFGGKHTCDKCSWRISSYERAVIKWLDKHNIVYIYQKKYKECKYVHQLPFDLYLQDYDILIEIDGQGHFYPVCYNNMTEKQAIKKFKETQKNDKIKNNFCKDYNITLIRIPYYDIENKNYIKILKDNLLE